MGLYAGDERWSRVLRHPGQTVLLHVLGILAQGSRPVRAGLRGRRLTRPGGGQTNVNRSIRDLQRVHS